MKIILLLSLFVLFSSGCATSTPKWQNALWYVKNHTGDHPEIGTLETDKLVFNFIVTEFREVIYNRNTQFEKGDPTFIAVSVTCRNHSSETLELQTNPIQVIGPSQMLVKELPLEHVRYKLYGGRLRRSAQLSRLDELNEPLPTVSAVPGAILLGIVAGIRASEKESIVSELYQKEASQYQLYYHSFDPVSLPGGVATSWTQYYPHTVGPIWVMLQGQKFEEGVVFSLPAPEPTLKPKNQWPLAAIIITCGAIAVSSLVYWVILG